MPGKSTQSRRIVSTAGTAKPNAKSKAEDRKEAILTAIEDHTLTPVLADAAKAAEQVYCAGKLIRSEELGTLLDQALETSGEPFLLTFDDGSSLYLTTTEGMLTATVSK